MAENDSDCVRRFRNLFRVGNTAASQPFTAPCPRAAENRLSPNRSEFRKAPPTEEESMRSAWAEAPVPETVRKQPANERVEGSHERRPAEEIDLTEPIEGVSAWLTRMKGRGRLNAFLTTDEELNMLDCAELPALGRIAENDWTRATEIARTALGLALGREATHVTLHGVGESVELEELGSEFMNRLIRTQGYVLRESPTELLVTAMNFRCEQCGSAIRQSFPSGEYCPPRHCIGDCPSKAFCPLRRSAECVLTQRVVLQELRTRRKRPVVFLAELREPLTGRARMGDEIDIVGVLRPEKLDREEGFGRTADAGLFTAVLEVRAVRRKGVPAVGADDAVADKLIEREAAFEALVAHFRPELSLNETAKALLVLALCASERIHLLLVEESGNGAASLLEFAEEVAAKTVKGDSFELFPADRGEEGGFEPGKILMCHKGFCAVPQLDALKRTEVAKLIGTIEAQKLVVRDAECFSTLEVDVRFACALRTPASCAQQLAAEHCCLPRGALGRFDFIVPIAHDPAFLRLAAAEKLLKKPAPRQPPRDQLAFPFSAHMKARADKLAADGLALELPAYRALLLRVSRAAEPRLEREVANYLCQFFESLRQSAVLGPRFFASLLKLARARARTELRASVSLQHADEVIELVRELLSAPFHVAAADDAPPKRSKAAAQPSLAKRQKAFLADLAATRSARQSGVFRLEEIRAAAERAGIELGDFALILERLNHETVLLYRGNDIYELSSRF